MMSQTKGGLMRRARNLLTGVLVMGWALVVVLGVARGSAAAPSDDAAASAPASAAIVLSSDESRRTGVPAGLPEEAAMLLVGTALIGVAAAVRRAA
jgi:hypothetical protein